MIPMSAAPAAPTADARPLRVLVVDDEPMVREVVTAYLERDGFVVAAVADGRAALDVLAASSPDLVVLDVMLPEVDGFDVLSRLRRQSEVPVILLTARTEEPDRILGLELGADDYVVKPFSPRELAARVRSVLRRTRPGPPSTRVAYGDLIIDGATREVAVGGDLIELTPKEFDLIAYLAANPRQVFSRGQLLEQVWDSSSDYQDPSTVTVHIRRLRQKIEDDASHPRWLQTVWGVGYKFEP
jgi:DNA-binding response OmpR family regulator